MTSFSFIDNININKNITSYSSNLRHRANYFSSLYQTTDLPYNKIYNNCQNSLCYTYSKNFIYKPHSEYGRVATTASGYLARRKRI
jgi:hypothetical protein